MRSTVSWLDRAPLGVHAVLGEARRGDRPKRAGPRVERQRADRDSVFFQAAEQRLAEVQPGRRRGHRAGQRA